MKHKTTHVNKGPPWWRSCRYHLALLAAFGYACFFLQRVNLSLAIVCMVNHTAVDILKHSGEINSTNDYEHGLFQTRLNVTVYSNLTVTYTNYSHFSSNEDECSSAILGETKNEDGEFVWPKETQGLLLSGLFWGYFLLNLPAQWVIQKTGSKNLALGSVLVLSVLSLVSPVGARAHVWALMAIRVVQGFATALGVSALYAIWGSWAPKEERAVLLGIVFTGNMLANAIVFPSSGFLCRHGFAGGWPSVFYVFGIIGMVWCLLWAVLVFETPESHPRIDSLEKKYIQSRSSVSNKKTTNGIYVMLPYISLFLISNIWAFICKVCLAKDLLSVAWMRNLSAIIGDVIPSTLYIIISFLDCSQATLVVFMMAMAVGISGTNLQCYLVNPFDIAPKYATAIFCISNTISVGTGIISPYVAAALTIDKTREQWQLAFFSTVGVTAFCLIFYLVFGSTRQMTWVQREELELELQVITPEEAKIQNLENRTYNLLDTKEEDNS